MTSGTDMSATHPHVTPPIATFTTVAVESINRLMTRTPVQATIMKALNVITIISINQILTADAHVRS